MSRLLYQEALQMDRTIISLPLLSILLHVGIQFQTPVSSQWLVMQKLVPPKTFLFKTSLLYLVLNFLDDEKSTISQIETTTTTIVLFL